VSLTRKAKCDYVKTCLVFFPMTENRQTMEQTSQRTCTPQKNLKGVRTMYATSSLKGRVNEKGEGGGVWLMFFIYLYENRTMKLVGIILSRGKGDKGE
jgi:hypothetical protein